MLLKIVQVGNPVLRAGTRELTRDEIVGAKVQQLIEWMRETMRDAPGVGLAAPNWPATALAVIEDGALVPEVERRPIPFHVVINPTLTVGGEMVQHGEGCLSLEGFQAEVPRAQTVRVQALDHLARPVTIDASGWYARSAAEIDHLDGKLYIDRMDARTFTTARNARRAGKEN